VVTIVQATSEIRRRKKEERSFKLQRKNRTADGQHRLRAAIMMTTVTIDDDDDDDDDCVCGR